MTLGAATREAVPGDPSYYVNRQAVYLVVGVILMVRARAGRLRAPAAVEKRRSTRC